MSRTKEDRAKRYSDQPGWGVYEKAITYHAWLAGHRAAQRDAKKGKGKKR